MTTTTRLAELEAKAAAFDQLLADLANVDHWDQLDKATRRAHQTVRERATR